MKYCLLPFLLILVLCGCQSDLYYQEKAVESAREFIYKHARELTPEQYAFVRMTPPVLLTGQIFGANPALSRAGGEKLQICIAWRIPDADKDYLVFGISEPQMAFWRPMRLIRRRLGGSDRSAWRAMDQARTYAIDALSRQLSFADLNLIRFTQPELARTSFVLKKAEELEKGRRVRPWKAFPQTEKNGQQLSLLWKISGERYAVFCGVGKEDLSQWQIAMAGIFDGKEVKKATVKHLKSSGDFLFPAKKNGSGAAPVIPVQEQKKTTVGKGNKAGGK